jgi:predicted PurR-regulated permease PerM
VITEHRVSWATLLKLGVALLAAWACLKLWPSFQLLLFATLIAIAFSPVVTWIEKRHISRGTAVLVLASVVVLLGVALAFFVLPPLTAQLATIWKTLPALRQSISRSFEKGSLGARIVLPLFDLPRSPALDAWLARPLAWGPPALEFVVALLIVVVLSLYLLLDGPKVVAWLLAYAPRRHRLKVGDTIPELFSVVQAYTLGQLVSSTLFGAFAFGILLGFGVPAALPLAFVAAACDVIPVAGILVVTVLAAICALTVSPTTALFVGGLFLLYHLFETYFLVPHLYGNRLQLSTLTVLLAILAGGELGGIPGAILALPLVAAYPVIEKHWLDERLHPGVIADHEALQESEDSSGQHELVTAMLEGRPLDSPR